MFTPSAGVFFIAVCAAAVVHGAVLLFIRLRKVKE